MKKLRVAVAGAGYFCQFQLDGWRRIPGVEIAAICNRDETKARALAERFGIPAVFAGVGAMLDGVDADILDIVTPPTTHREYVGEAARRGIATICPGVVQAVRERKTVTPDLGGSAGTRQVAEAVIAALPRASRGKTSNS